MNDGPKQVNVHVMLVDDDREMRDSLGHFLTRSGCLVSAFDRAEPALAALEEDRPDVVVTDLRMPGLSGMEFLTRAKALPGAPPVVLISAHGDVPMAVEAMRDGAYNFLEKPFEPRRLLTILTHAAEAHALSNQNRRLRARLADLAGLDHTLVGESRIMKDLREDILDVSDTEAPVLILGETGTGKEVVAHALHDLSSRGGGPFVAVNCAAIPETLFEASMFGHLGGAFTGATGAQNGYFIEARGGTLFLDELGACPLELQAKLLRAIETHEVVPVGGTRPVAVDIRLVSATNEGLEEAVAAGRFREDLYYRLNTVELLLPPLRDRREDVPLLFTHFLEHHAATYGLEPPSLTTEEVATLMAHGWPGNVRELKHAAERRVLAARRGRGRGRGTGVLGPASGARGGEGAASGPGTLKEAVAAYERTLIIEALKAHGGGMDAAADALGIGRRTLNEKLVKLDIARREIVGDRENGT
ncbi:MAG: sigma-54 dependent transcriptional regulator [Rhodospirillum sp.]|nr:sigma-54 dependent transcriptional regulator [Rhodospirillum sp.]MCF8491116.1 sigma-54 dependent transcriptional regulator [Rhodospirillum sp.]MCF8502433.1 sigma-54 dependent transcriptional regulator [Rhodospirillum sp.]